MLRHKRQQENTSCFVVSLSMHDSYAQDGISVSTTMTTKTCVFWEKNAAVEGIFRAKTPSFPSSSRLTI